MLMKTDSDAIALVEELDGLPLALSTAGTYPRRWTLQELLAPT